MLRPNHPNTTNQMERISSAVEVNLDTYMLYYILIGCRNSAQNDTLYFPVFGTPINAGQCRDVSRVPRFSKSINLFSLNIFRKIMPIPHQNEIYLIKSI